MASGMEGIPRSVAAAMAPTLPMLLPLLPEEDGSGVGQSHGAGGEFGVATVTAAAAAAALEPAPTTAGAGAAVAAEPHTSVLSDRMRRKGGGGRVWRGPLPPLAADLLSTPQRTVICTM